MKPETEPEEPEAISAVSDQNELCERYSAPAPPARTMLASPALCACEPNVRNTAEEERKNGDAASSDAFSVQSREFVADRAAQRTAGGHRKEKQRRIGRAGLQIQSPDFSQINKEPGKKNPSNIAETKVGERDSPDVLGGEDGAPKNAVIGCSNT